MIEYASIGVDFDKTGKISYHEFLAATINTQAITEENLKIAFDKMSNHNLYISCEDIVDLLGEKGSEEEVSRMLEENHLNASSRIYFDQVQTLIWSISTNKLYICKQYIYKELCALITIIYPCNVVQTYHDGQWNSA